MANWQRHLNLLPEWILAKDGAISVQQLAEVVAARLEILVPFEEDYVEIDRNDLVYEFRLIANDLEASIEEFDNLMEELYNWADQSLDSDWNGKKVCWVKIF